MPTQTFEQIAHRWLTNFQQDLKDFLHVVCDDPDLDDGLREASAAAVLYALAPGDVIPDSAGPGPLGFVDDAMVLRIVLQEISEKAPERYGTYGERIPELIENLEDDIAASKKYLEECYEPFRVRVLLTDKIEFKGKKVPDVLADPEWLDDEVSVAALKLDFKPNDVNAATKRLATLLPVFRQKLIPRK